MSTVATCTALCWVVEEFGHRNPQRVVLAITTAGIELRAVGIERRLILAHVALALLVDELAHVLAVALLLAGGTGDFRRTSRGGMTKVAAILTVAQIAL